MTQNCWNTPTSSANGQLLIGSSSGPAAWATITDGTATTVTEGAGTISVAFDTASGSFELISSATASTSTSIDFTDLSSTYDTYLLTMQGVKPGTDDVIMRMQTSTNNGVSYDSGATDYCWNSIGVNDGGTLDPEGSTGDNEISLAGDQASEELGNSTNETLAGNLWIYKPAGTGYTKFNFDFTFLDLAQDQNSVTGGAARLSAADVDAITIYMTSGSVSVGNFRLYGYKA